MAAMSMTTNAMAAEITPAIQSETHATPTPAAEPATEPVIESATEPATPAPPETEAPQPETPAETDSPETEPSQTETSLPEITTPEPVFSSGPETSVKPSKTTQSQKGASNTRKRAQVKTIRQRNQKNTSQKTLQIQM